MTSELSTTDVDFRRFEEKTTVHLRSKAESSEALRKMYYFNPAIEEAPVDTAFDLLNEKISTPVFGTVRKFDGRLLVLLSYTCAANCRYCERQDRVGVGLDREGRLTIAQIEPIIEYVRNDPTLTEIIASGGDPLTNSKGLEYLFDELAKIEHVKVLRIHTRFPMQSPERVNVELMAKLAQAKPSVYLSLHIDHPDELTPEVVDLIGQFRRMGYILLCQSVFLKGINDSVETLQRMYQTLYELGVRPYYIYHCQRIQTTAAFEMDFADEVKIMTELRERLSGAAFPQHVLDLPGSRGKVVVPTLHWDVDFSKTQDFDGLVIDTETWKVQ